MLNQLTSSGIRGGATYDALIGCTASHHGASLMTLDVRAAATYEALGIVYERLS